MGTSTVTAKSPDNISNLVHASAGAAIYQKDAQGRFLSSNLNHQKFMGRSAEQIIGHTVEEIGAVNDEYPPLIDDADILAGKTIRQVAGKLLDGNNQPRDVIVSKSPLVIGGKIAGIVGVIEDITDQIAQSKALAELTEAIQNVPSGILVYHWNGFGDYKLIMANPVARKLFNIPDDTDEDLDSIMVKATHPDDRWCFDYLKGEVAAGRQETSCQCRFLPIGAHEYIYLKIRLRCVPKDDGCILLYVSLTDVTAEQRSAQALAEAQKAYQEVAAGAGLVVWIYNISNDAVEFLSDNDAISRVIPVRLPHKLANGPHFVERFLSSECREDFRRLHANLKQGIAGSCEIKYQVKLGQPPHWARLIYNLPKGASHSTIAYGVGINITAEKLRSIQYNAEMRMLHTAVKSNLLSKSHFDLTNNKLLDYIQHSPNALNIHEGISYDDFFNILLNMIISPEERRLVSQKLNIANLLQLCAEENRNFSLEYRRHCEDLSPIMVECTVSLFINQSNHVECFICFYDITNKFLNYIIADKLNDMGYLFVALVNILTGTMTFYSKKTGVLESTPRKPLFYNEELLRMLNKYYQDSEKAQKLYKHSCLESILNFLDTHANDAQFDFSFDFYDSNASQISCRRLQACYLDSSHTSIFIIQSDITKQYQKEMTQLKMLETALAEAERANASKSLFLAGISHDMRTPLNGIMSFTDFALKTESRSQQHYFLTKIRQSGELLLALINDTLNLTRIESGKVKVTPEWMDTRAMLDEVLTGVTMAANDRQLTLNVEQSSDLPHYIIGDKLKIQEILLNIISNAIKFTKPGGSVNVIIDTIPLQLQTSEEMAMSESDGHKWLRAIIRDTGIGMSQEFLPHIFEAFTQEDSREVDNPNGTGLGLSIVKKYVDMMNGTIQVRSELGKGTTFEVHLMVEKAGPKPVQQKAAAENCHFGHLRVLLAEDNVLNQEIAAMLLSSKGITADIANNGQRAVEMFEAAPPNQYQLILMDLRMPVMSGYEATLQIRQGRNPDGAKIPIIAMTADAYDDDIKRCLEAGMNGHVSKPINPDKLYKEIAKWCSDK